VEELGEFVWSQFAVGHRKFTKIFRLDMTRIGHVVGRIAHDLARQLLTTYSPP
jgi:hypothetical protein